MASIIDITNPLTGAVEKVDQLDHTAQEIDSAVSRALPGGEIDRLFAGKAPAGLVSARYEASVESEVDTILQAEYESMENRSLRFIVIDSGVQGEVFTGGTWHFTLYRTTETFGVISAISYSGISGKSGTVVSNTLYAGEWTGWTFENPPMQLGKEYRTTERYLGKPVYVKSVDFGALPNSGVRNVPIEEGNSNIVSIRSSGVLNNGVNIPGYDPQDTNSTNQIQCFGWNSVILIAVPYDASHRTAVVTVWYYKTDD